MQMTAQGNAIPYHNCYFSLISVQDGSDLVLKSLKWRSRCYGMLTVFECASLLHLKRFYKGMQAALQRRREEPLRSRKQPKTDGSNFWRAVLATKLKALHLVCVLLYLKVQVELHRCLWNIPQWDMAGSFHPHKSLPEEQESLALDICSRCISLVLFQTSICKKQNKWENCL